MSFTEQPGNLPCQLLLLRGARPQRHQHNARDLARQPGHRRFGGLQRLQDTLCDLAGRPVSTTTPSGLLPGNPRDAAHRYRSAEHRASKMARVEP